MNVTSSPTLSLIELNKTNKVISLQLLTLTMEDFTLELSDTNRGH